MYDLVKELNLLNERQRIISKLSALNLSIDYTKKKMTTKNIYYMVILDYGKMKVTIREFKSSELEIATRSYAEIESKPNINVVLASATSFKTLREAYPNYFADIKKFIKMVKNIVRKYENQTK